MENKNSEKLNVRNSKSSDEIMDIFCESCFKDGVKNVPAEGFCVNCVTFLCKTCLKYHAKFLQDHVQQNQEDMPKDFCQEICEIHKNEIVKFYCQSCECFVCPTCKLDNHRGCESVQYVPALLEEFKDEKVYESLRKKLDTLEEKLDHTKVLIDKGYDHVEQSTEKTLSEVREHNDKISKLFERLKEDIDKVRSEGMQSFKENSEQLSELISKFQGVRSKLQRIERTNQRCDLFMTVKESEKVVQSIDEQIESLNAEIDIYIKDFKTEIIIKSTDDLGILSKVRHEKNVETQRHDAKNEKHMRCITGFWFWGIVMVIIPVLAAMTCFHLFNGGTPYENGLVSEESYKGREITREEPITISSADISIKIESTPDPDIENSLISEESYKGRNITREEPITISTADISIKTKSTPVLHKLCILNKNYLIAFDRYAELLLLFSTVEKKIISDYQHQYGIRDIAKVSENEIVLIFYASPEIHFLRVNYKHSIKRITWLTIKILNISRREYAFYHIAYRNEMLFIVNSGNEIINFDMDGNIKRTLFLTDPGHLRFYIYLNVRNVAESVHIFSYLYNHSMKVVRLTSEELHETVYTHDDLKGPAGMAADDSGNIYVCGLNSHNIHVLTDDLTKGDVLLDEKDGIKNPRAIAVSDEDKKIFIYSLFSDVISVYRFV